MLGRNTTANSERRVTKNTPPAILCIGSYVIVLRGLEPECPDSPCPAWRSKYTIPHILNIDKRIGLEAFSAYAAAQKVNLQGRNGDPEIEILA